MVAMCPPRSLSDGVKVMTAEEPSSRGSSQRDILRKETGLLLKSQSKGEPLSPVQWNVASCPLAASGHFPISSLSNSFHHHIWFISYHFYLGI